MLGLVRLIFLLISYISIVYCKFCPTNVGTASSGSDLKISWTKLTKTDLNQRFTVMVCCEGYYRQDTAGETECIPVCKHGCENGRCIEPNRCACNERYVLKNERCVPECSNCTNGYCIGPNQCICNEGYVMNNIGLCDPKCKDGCVNGICNEQNKCVCHEGYFFNDKFFEFGIRNNTMCTPKCDQPCSHGICKERNRCKCDSGYTLTNISEPFTCVPECVPQWVNCTHGKCIAPNQCKCDEGYKVVKKSCVPACEPACINGNCIAPGECHCLQGYQITNDSNICEPLYDPPVNNTYTLAENMSYVMIPIVAGICTVLITFGVIIIIAIVVIKRISHKNNTLYSLDIDSSMSCSDDYRKAMNLTNPVNHVSWPSIVGQRTNAKPSVPWYDTPIEPPTMVPLQRTQHEELIVNENSSAFEHHFYELIQETDNFY